MNKATEKEKQRWCSKQNTHADSLGGWGIRKTKAACYGGGGRNKQNKIVLRMKNTLAEMKS